MRGGRGAGLNVSPATTTKLHLRGPLHHAAHGPPPPLSRGRIILPRSRDAASHPSFASRFKKALPTASQEGRRSADKRIHWSPPRRREKSLPAFAARAIPRSTRTARDLRSGTLAFRRSTATLRRGSDLNSAPGRASWNHRIQTGGPSPAPVQPAPGSPVTRRTVDAQSRPDAGYKPASGNRARPIDRLSPVDVPSMGELALRNYNGDGCQGVSQQE